MLSFKYTFSAVPERTLNEPELRVALGRLFNLSGNIEDMDQALQLQISAGIGFGFSANEAGTHARIALNQSLDFGGAQCFIVKEDRSVIGPVEKEAPLTYPLTIIDSNLTGESQRHRNFSSVLGKNHRHLAAEKKPNLYRARSAQDLASSLGVTTRSAHRILLKWLDAHIVEIACMEKVQSRERPRQVYQHVQ
ncbi:hypothetical protein [Thalassobacillus sp. CUG 92003]|uniref:hypothetical protein n=1 Tax=Thalassobacillus sp. CUG 92003 TaxID=2736641 RepID=UPI0015E7DC2D|nr:hypothetical protein [Thalassobacillus sp. CUG 92003]